MRARFVLAYVLAAAGLASAACGGITTPSSNVSTPFSGTLPPQGLLSHPFSVSKTGEFTVKLTAWAPNSSVFVGLILATGNNDGSCSTNVLQTNNFVNLNSQGLGGQIFSGKYCVFIYDTGSLTAPQTYTLNVSHPG